MMDLEPKHLYYIEAADGTASGMVLGSSVERIAQYRADYTGQVITIYKGDEHGDRHGERVGSMRPRYSDAQIKAAEPVVIDPDGAIRGVSRLSATEAMLEKGVPLDVG